MAGGKSTSGLGIDFTEGNITKLLIWFLAPLVLANILNSLYNTVDMVIIGHFGGSAGTVAVSIGGKMLLIFTMIANGFSSGGQVLVSQQIGAGQHSELKKTIGTLFSLLLAVSTAFMLICLFLSVHIIRWLNTPAESFDSALAYLRITCVGLPLLFGYVAVSTLLRGMGDSRNPLLFIAVAAVFNVIMDIVFIVVFDMGAAGTALATVLGQGISLVFSVALLYRKRDEFGFDFRPASFAIDEEKLKIILRIGLPMALRSGMIQGTQLVMMSLINQFGLVQSAVYGIGDKILHLLNVVDQSVYQSGGAMVGQNIGAGRFDRVKDGVRSCLAITLIFTAAISVFCLMAPRLIFGLFTKDEAVLAFSPSFMAICVLTFVLSSLMCSFGTVTIGTGNSKLSFLGGFLDGVVFRVAFSLLFGYYFGMGVTGFFLGNALARLGPLLVHGAYYASGAWIRRKRLVNNTLSE